MSTTTEIFKDSVSAIGKALGLKEGEQGEKGGAQALPEHAIALLTMQHREVDALFAEIEASGESAFKTKEKLVETLIQKITLHTHLEEEIFYPAAREADKDLVLESFEEHAAVKDVIARLQGVEADDETFMPKVKLLRELIHHHVREEEGSLFPKCETVLGEDTIQALGHEMVEEVERMERHGQRGGRRQRGRQAPKAASSRGRAASSRSKGGKAAASSSKASGGRKSATSAKRSAAGRKGAEARQTKARGKTAKASSRKSASASASSSSRKKSTASRKGASASSGRSRKATPGTTRVNSRSRTRH